jgi:type II secretory pathway component PulK
LKKQNDVEKQKQMAPILFPELLQLYIQWMWPKKETLQSVRIKIFRITQNLCNDKEWNSKSRVLKCTASLLTTLRVKWVLEFNAKCFNLEHLAVKKKESRFNGATQFVIVCTQQTQWERGRVSEWVSEWEYNWVN